MTAPVRLAWTPAPVRVGRREAAWALLRDVVGAPVRIENTCPRCGGGHGAVRVHAAAGTPRTRASIAYAGGYAIVALAPASAASSIGVDAESAESARDLAAVLGRPGATARDWVRVEAALKADGRGLRVEPARVEVAAVSGGACAGSGGSRVRSSEMAPRATPEWTAVVPDRDDPLHGWDVTGPAGVLVSVALAGAAERSLRTVWS